MTCTVRPSRPLEWAAWRPWRRSDFSLPTRWKASQLNRLRFLGQGNPSANPECGIPDAPPYPPPHAGEDTSIYPPPLAGEGRVGAKQREFARATSIDHGLG